MFMSGNFLVKELLRVCHRTATCHKKERREAPISPGDHNPKPGRISEDCRFIPLLSKDGLGFKGWLLLCAKEKMSIFFSP